MVKAQAGLLETDTVAEAEAKLATVVEAVPGQEREWVATNVRPLIGLPAGQSSSVTETFAAWRRLFESLAEQRPLVLVFEDLHWADDGLLDFIDHLVDWAVSVPLLVVCSARPELLERRPSWGGGKLNATTIALSPLTDEDSARLVASLLDQPLLPAELQQVLLEHADGNPLFAEQYVRMLTDRGLLVRQDSGWAFVEAGDLPLPETLQGIIAARLDGLPADEKRLLQDASVLGKIFWLGALASADERSTQAKLHLLERKGFVRRERRSSVADETEYAFAHALVRDVSYGQIPRIERARKHRRAAEWIQQLGFDRGEDRAQLAAYHWLAALELTRAAGQDDPELAARACAALVAAGERTDRLGATDRARELYAQALALLPADDDDRPTLLLLYGRAASSSGVDADAELIEATEWFLAAADVERAAQAMLARTWFLWNAGGDLESSRLLERGLELVADRPPSTVQALLYGEFAVHSMLKGRLDDAVSYAERELEIGSQVGIERTRADALITIGSARGIGGEHEGLSQIEQGLALALELNDVRVIVRGYKNLQSLVAVHGELDRASAIAEDGRRAAMRYGDGFHVGWFQVEQALYMYFRGEWEEALGRLRSFLGDLGERKHYMVGPGNDVLGRIQAERGELADGIAHSALGLEFARSVRDHQQLLPSLASHACVLMRAGRSAEAGRLLDEYLPLVDQAGHSLADAALALTLLGREAEFGELPPIVRRSRWGIAAGAFAEGDFATAAALYQGMGTRVHEAEARLRLARQHAAKGGQADADHEAAAAAAFFLGAGAEPRLAESQAAIRASA
jgi:hypothetical protein